jgi:hypothetical protein
MRTCRTCHNMAERLRTAKRRSKAERQAVAQFAIKLKNETDDRRLRLLCLGMIQKFGGIEDFTKAWTGQYKLACERNPGGMAAMGFFLAVTRLSQYCEDHRRKPSQMTDVELRERMKAHVEEVIRAHPELAVECSRQIGWVVEPIGG